MSKDGQMAKIDSNNLVWIDLEMTGLDASCNQILEIASIVTDSNLNIIAEGPELVIHCPESKLEKMDDWNQTHHKASGLWQRAVSSKITVKQAEEQTLEFIKQYCSPQKNPLCGNSIGQDKLFLLSEMPKITDFLHYRVIDVSSIKELVTRWYPSGSTAFIKKGEHRALADIKESIEELKHYRDKYFLPDS